MCVRIYWRRMKIARVHFRPFMRCLMKTIGRILSKRISKSNYDTKNIEKFLNVTKCESSKKHTQTKEESQMDNLK